MPAKLLALAATIGLVSAAVAQGTAEQREACTPDALRLCSDTIPDIAKTTACMKAHEAELSQSCRAIFAQQLPASRENRVTAPDDKLDRPRSEPTRERRRTRSARSYEPRAVLRHHVFKRRDEPLCGCDYEETEKDAYYRRHLDHYGEDYEMPDGYPPLSYELGWRDYDESGD